ncbi:hypothetical protein A9K97_gp420 [Tokyovirus A1]|uniref:hypothetical protein n=1 Tax=Tokyovirus A1 TaxID=1826170 RepID=UPI0007A98ECC|nr:hypothetical protein A9K97_gp420 [Tokyovirus A1]BAU79931.1 hypothetical protein [Tokyovirus A1]
MDETFARAVFRYHVSLLRNPERAKKLQEMSESSKLYAGEEDYNLPEKFYQRDEKPLVAPK